MNQNETKTEGGVKIITPRNILREKIGYGGIDPVVLDRAEEIIRNSEKEFDYAEYAHDFLARMEKVMAEARKSSRNDKNVIKALTNPVMDLKASGGMFGYALVSEIADVILDFLEGLEALNDDALEIFDIHHKTLNAIITNGLKGDGGAGGLALSKELYRACQRYQKKHLGAKKE